jgi:hypothetical protein
MEPVDETCEVPIVGRTGAGSGYPPLDPVRSNSLRNRAARAIAATPGLGELRGRLLERDGREVVLVWHEPHVGQLLSRGRDFNAADPDTCILGESMCHSNAALLWRLSLGEVGIVTGYALSGDGLWRQHSWGLRGERVVETTRPRVRYFGFKLTGEEAEKFASENLPPELSHEIDVVRAMVRPLPPVP